jgi:protoheme IX farnesyltransferase
VPVLLGWSAAKGSLDLEAWALFAILFLWQLPHFLAIAWMYREDYARAGFKMLGAVDAGGDVLARQAVIYGMALIPAGLMPAVIGESGPVYALGALALSLYYLRAALGLMAERSGRRARGLLRASVIYLPTLFGLMLIDRYLLG